MLTEEQFNEKIMLSTISVDENINELSIEECIKGLSKEGLEKLYSSYDISDCYEQNSYHSKKNTKIAKIKYLIKEIPGQFIDYYRFMMPPQKRKILTALLNGKKVKIDYEILYLAEFGFVYFKNINNEIKVVMPYELKHIVEDLFL